MQLNCITSQLNVNVGATKLYYKPSEHKVAEYKTPLITSITMLESVCNYIKLVLKKVALSSTKITQYSNRLAQYNIKVDADFLEQLLQIWMLKMKCTIIPHNDKK